MRQVRLLCPTMNDADQTLVWTRQRPGGKGERMRTTQAGCSRVDKVDSPIYLRNFTMQDSNRSLYRDLKEDVAGARGHRSSEMVMKRHRQIMEAKVRLLSRSLSLLYVQRNGWSGRQNKKRQLVFAMKCWRLWDHVRNGSVSSTIYKRDRHLCEETGCWLAG